MKTKYFSWGVGVVLGVLVICSIGCGRAALGAGNGSNNGRKELEARITAESGGLIRLVEYTKVRETRRPVNSKTMIEYEYTGEVEMAEDCLWNPLGYMARPDTRADKSVSPDRDWRAMTKGQREKISSRIMVPAAN